jgi:hypothetical protein
VISKRWAVPALSIALAFLGACSSTGGLLLYFDPYEFEVLAGRGIDAEAIRQALPKSHRVRIEVSPAQLEAQEAERRFAEVIERTTPRWIYVSAAHPFDPQEIASRYPGIRFFVVGSGGAGTSNRINVVYDREPAHYEAGMAIAGLLGNAEFLERIGASGAGAAEPRVGILTAVGSATIDGEIDAFVEGFAQLADPGRIEVREIGNLTDRVKARRFLDGMREREVAIVYLKTYVLSGFCLDYLSKGSGIAMVDGPISEQAYGNTVLLMLVDDFLGALAVVGESVEQDAPGGTPEPVIAPVQLRWAQAYRSFVEEDSQESNRQGVNQR